MTDQDLERWKSTIDWTLPASALEAIRAYLQEVGEVGSWYHAFVVDAAGAQVFEKYLDPETTFRDLVVKNIQSADLCYLDCRGTVCRRGSFRRTGGGLAVMQTPRQDRLLLYVARLPLSALGEEGDIAFMNWIEPLKGETLEEAQWLDQEADLEYEAKVWPKSNDKVLPQKPDDLELQVTISILLHPGEDNETEES